jgi:heme/copper-type cytochrome/quinol oxidase subunit 2
LLRETQQNGLEAKLSMPAEIIWTALPIAMTILLITAAYRIWEAR